MDSFFRESGVRISHIKQREELYMIVRIKKKIIFLMVLITIILVSMVKVTVVKASSNMKEYPERDKNLPTYKTIQELPDAVYTTMESENEWTGNCYYATGKVKGVFKGFSKLCKAMKIKYEKDNDETLDKLTYILLQTKKGYVVVCDLFSLTSSMFFENLNAQELSQEEKNSVLNALIAEYGYFEPYDELPRKGEKIKIFLTYSGYSEVTKTPMCFYGINKTVIDACKGKKTIESNPKTKTFKFENIKLDIPENWIWDTQNDVYKYFITDDGFLMVTSNYLNGATEITEGGLNAYIDSFEKGANLKLTSCTKKKYRNGSINEYYILIFKGKKENKKIKIKEMLFEYKGDSYTVGYSSDLTDNSDIYFKIFSKIIKSVKPLK